jgi:hypothetical protein
MRKIVLTEWVTYESFAGSWPYVPDKPDAAEGEKIYARHSWSTRAWSTTKTLVGGLSNARNQMSWLRYISADGATRIP